MNVVVAATIIVLHTLDGGEVRINSDLIVSLREQAATDLLVDRAKCMVNTNDGKFTTVIESCATIHDMMKRNGR